jgi:superoxide dismutase, Cu-Zn family
MRKTCLPSVFAAAVLVTSLSLAREGAHSSFVLQAAEWKPVAMAALHNASGEPVGVASFTQDGNRVLVRITVQNLLPGFHGLHLHGTGACHEHFVSAGGHFNPTGQSHPNHAGDLPVLLVNGDGTGETSFATDRFKVEELFDGDGSALIIHAGPDNYGNIPPDRYDPDADTTTSATGDAGARAACGALVRD